jgi:tetratricopeptide (TPR) repeat protein
MQRAASQLLLCLLVMAASCTAAGDDSAENGSPPQIDWASHLLVLPGASPDIRGQYSDLTEALAAGSLDEAETTAKQMAESAAANAGTKVVARARTLHNLGVVQHLRADYAAAILNYKAAVGAINSAQDMLSLELVEPLHALGIAYTDNGDPVAALDAFDTALHISNVNDGPHSLQQVPVLRSLQSLHERQGDAVTASVTLDRIHQLHLRQYGPDSEELLPVLREQAEFYKRHHMPTREYMAWRESLLILRRHRGHNDLSLIEPQLNLAHNLIRDMRRIRNRSGPTAPSAEKYLKRALAISTHNPDADWKVKRRTTLALADYYMLIGMYAQGHRYYRDAWQLMSDGSLLSQREHDLETIVPISRPHPDPYANFEYNPDTEKIDPDDYRQGLIVAEFTVNVRGRAEDVRIVEQSPPDFERMEWRMRTALKDFVYRPRFVDGEPEKTNKYRYSLEYFYLPEEYEASLAKSGKLNRPTPPDLH